MSLLYDKYAAALFGVVMRVVNSTEIAEEVLQDVFVKAWRNIDSYNAAKGRLFTWLLNIARNAAIDATRSKNFNRQNQSIETIVDIAAHDSTSPNPETIGLKKLTEQLPPEQQTLVDYIYFKGYTQSETAEALNIPLGTVKTRLRAAMQNLKSLF